MADAPPGVPPPGARLGMLVYSYYPDDPRVRREAEALAAAGFAVEVLALRGPEERPEEWLSGVHVRRLPLRRRRGGALGYLLGYTLFFWLAAARLAAIAPARRYAVVQVHNMPDFLVFAALVPRLLGARIVLDVHDPTSDVFASLFGGPLGRLANALLRLQERLSYAFADQLITVHDGMREWLLARGVAPERVTVVLNVPDLALFAPRAAATPAEPGAPEGTFTLLYAGTLSSRHGLDLAIEAIDQLRDELPGLRLRIVGDGPERERLAALVAARGLSARVTLAGPRPLEAMPGELAACDAALSPHRAGAFGELTFPTKILEALAMGRPVVAARTAMVVRYLGEDLLYLFEPGSAAGLAAQIRRLCAGPAEAAARVARARQTLAQLSWQQQRLTLIRLMIGLCAGRPARGQTETTQ